MFKSGDYDVIDKIRKTLSNNKVIFRAFNISFSFKKKRE